MIPARPHVLLSAATSLDGYLDDATDRRLVLSGAADLDRVDAERAGVDAVLVGAGTVRADDPRLLVRSALRRDERAASGRAPSPLRVVLAGRDALDPGSALFTTGDAQCLVYAPPGTDQPGTLIAKDPHDLTGVLADLAGRGVVRLLVEGGAAVHRTFLAADVVDELHLVHAPVLVGDAAPAPRFTAPGPGRMHLMEARVLGEDVLLRLRAGDADDRWLAEACALAERCPPSSSAFSVGAVLVAADGAVLATGDSRRDNPDDHAEEVALRAVDPADRRLAGATLYCSLEPCGTRSSRPMACARRIVDAGVGRVVFAWREPTRFVVAPSGVAQLVAGGVEVVELGRWAEVARRPNR